MRQRFDDLNKQDYSTGQVQAMKSELVKLKSQHSLEFERTRKQLSQALEIIENNHKTINELSKDKANHNRIQASQQSQDVKRAVFKNKFKSQPNVNRENEQEFEDSFDRKNRIINDFDRRSNDKDIRQVISTNPNHGMNNHQKSGKKISFAQPSSHSLRTSNRPKERRYESKDQNPEDNDDSDEYEGRNYDQVDGGSDEESCSEYESDKDSENYDSDNSYSEENDEEDEKEYTRKIHKKSHKNYQQKDPREIRFR